MKYVSIDTQSDPASADLPSTLGQLVLLHTLADELREMGAADVAMDANGYVTATIPATQGCESEPTIGFLAHVDTSPDAPGAGVRPVMTLDIDGDTIITSDGTTLLGADDKAGVAEIMTAAEYLLAHPEVRHGRVRIAFTSDEEIGRGVDRFDVAAFGADFAYTVDGGWEGELEWQNFNAAEAIVTIHGRSAHPGYARGMMLNALTVAREFDSSFPTFDRPETTSGFQGFYHLARLEGSVAHAEMEYIVRDHDQKWFEIRKKRLVDIAARLNEKYRGEVVEVALRDQYYNMKEVMKQHPEVVERARRAIKAAGVSLREPPTRGGTDGARLSFMGLPCPNLFTGGFDFHSLTECVYLGAMQKAVEVIVEIVRVQK